jgi:hypothetical protein
VQGGAKFKDLQKWFLTKWFLTERKDLSRKHLAGKTPLVVAFDNGG